MTHIYPGSQVSWSSGYDSKTLHGKVVEVFTKDGKCFAKVRVDGMLVPFQVAEERLSIHDNCA